MANYVLHCKKCGYGYGYWGLTDRDKAMKSKRHCTNCGKFVKLLNGGSGVSEYALQEYNKERKIEWQKKTQDKKNKSKISIITGAILAGLAAISGFIISFLEEIKAFLAQASNLIVEIIDIISNFFSSFG